MTQTLTPATDRPYNERLGNLRRASIFILIAPLVILARPRPWSAGVGIGVIALGEMVRVWAAGHLLKSRELVTSGPYRYTRNPLYLGRILILTGLCVAADLPYGGSWIALLLGYVGFFGYYLPRKERVEPARLEAIHGAAFKRYRESVPALFPRLRPHGKSTRAWSWSRMLTNREHWMVVGLALVSVFLLVRLR